jgi:hypothetical protein
MEVDAKILILYAYLSVCVYLPNKIINEGTRHLNSLNRSWIANSCDGDTALSEHVVNSCDGDIALCQNM